MLKAAGLILFGSFSIVIAVWTGLAWRQGKRLPSEYLGGIREARTEMNAISLVFEIFFEVVIGLICIGFGMSLLSVTGA